MKHLARLTTLAIALSPAVALAQVQTYYHEGAWDAFSGRSSNGGAVCGIGNTNPSDKSRLSLHFDIGDPDTTFSASKPDWSIPDNTEVPVVIQVGLNTPWTQQATGYGHTIDWRLDQTAIQTFNQQFRTAPSMTIYFLDGNEPPWTLSLAGSTVISDTFARCIRDLTRQVQAAQRPPSTAPETGAPTQPFSAPPASVAH
jgi:hypothetical protein